MSASAIRWILLAASADRPTIYWQSCMNCRNRVSLNVIPTIAVTSRSDEEVQTGKLRWIEDGVLQGCSANRIRYWRRQLVFLPGVSFPRPSATLR